MNLRKRHSPLPRLTGPQPQIISRIRWHDGMARDELDSDITKQLKDLWTGQLSQKEELQQMAEFEKKSLDEADSKMKIFEKLDAVIINQAKTLGWRTVLSSLVLLRMRHWGLNENGPERFQDLGRAFATSARILLRKERPPVDNPDLALMQDHTVPELRMIRKELKRVLGKKHRTESDREILITIIKIVDSDEKYPQLKANLLLWLNFFNQNPAILKTLIFAPHPPLTDIFREWLSASKRYEPETLRKKISFLRRYLRN